MQLIRTSILNIQENKGRPRLWIEGKFLEDAGFRPGRKVKTVYGDNRITVTLANDGDHTVASNRKARHYAILDYNASAIRQAIQRAPRVEVQTRFGQITITPTYRATRQATRKTDGTLGSVFSGGGLMDQAAKLAGYTSSFALEINPAYADIWQHNHKGHMLAGCISQFNLRRLPRVDLLMMGVPCEPFSTKRRHKNNQKREVAGPADHDLIDLSFWGMMVVDQCNPQTVLIENVPAYVESEIGLATMAVLRRMGYNVEHRIIDGTEFGALTIRKRAVIAAKDGPITWPSPCPEAHRLGEVLLNPDDPECEWFHQSNPIKAWIFEHWTRQTEKGNGFASQQLTADTPAVQTISKRYFNGQGDAPIVKDTRPGREGWYRWLTLGEVKAIMGLSPEFDLGEAKTLGGHVIGQGVLVNVFRRIIESIAPRTTQLSCVA